MFNSLQEFADYVWSFYSPNSDLYPIKSLTIEDVFHAIEIYFERIVQGFVPDDLDAWVK